MSGLYVLSKSEIIELRCILNKTKNLSKDFDELIKFLRQNCEFLSEKFNIKDNIKTHYQIDKYIINCVSKLLQNAPYVDKEDNMRPRL